MRKPIDWAAILRHVVLNLTSWGVVTAVFFTRDYYITRLLQRRVAVAELLFSPFVHFLLWALVSPFMIEVVRRHPLRAPKRGRTLLILALSAVAFGVLRSVLGWAVSVALDTPPMSHREFFEYAVLARWFNEAQLAAVVMGVFTAIDMYRHAQERARAALALEADLARSQLQFLKAQLQPHFLFNTLNTISSLVESQPRAAEKMIADLSDLLRRSLESVDELQVPLARELEFVRRYADLQKMRFGERLRITFDVDRELSNVPVPSMILQPLVENSIVHAISSRAEGGSIEVRARAEDGALTLQVIDDGPGQSDAKGSGIGLANTRARLRHLHGDAATLQFRNEEDRFIVEVRVPMPKETPA